MAQFTKKTQPKETTPELASKPQEPDPGLANNVIPGAIGNALFPSPESLNTPQEAPISPAVAPEEATAPLDERIEALKAEITRLQARLAEQPVPTARIAPSLPATTPDGKRIQWATGVPTVTKTAQ